ncbi:hypothetical protein BN934_02862 [Lacticaseibacillus rhamnosus]|nr:hypothetical protein BN934_02862 [Lacticaseibacillus rhamnosus]
MVRLDSKGKADAAAGVAFQPAGEFQFEQHGLEDRGGDAALADQFVDRHWDRA